MGLSQSLPGGNQARGGARSWLPPCALTALGCPLGHPAGSSRQRHSGLRLLPWLQLGLGLQVESELAGTTGRKQRDRSSSESSRLPFPLRSAELKGASEAGGADSPEPGSGLDVVFSQQPGTPTPTALSFPGDISQRACRDMEGADLAVKLLSTWLTLVGGLILLPSAFGLSLGISEIYMKILVKTLEVSAGKDVEPRLL